MSRSGLLFLCLSVLITATPTSSSNYDLIHNFTVTYMTSYEGKLFNSSNACFGSAATSKLDADVVAMMKSLVFGKVEDVMMYATMMVSDFKFDLETCQMADIATSFRNNLKVHGYEYFLGNVFWRALDIYASAARAALDLLEFNYYKLAQELGTITKYLNPPLLSLPKFEMQPAPHNFVSGLLDGLQLTPGAPDTCYIDLNALSSDENQFVNDMFSLFGGNVDATFSLVSDVKTLVTAITNSAPACNLSALGGFFTGLLTAEGITQAATNLGNNIDTIKEASSALETCPQDFYQCGYSAGEIFRLVSGWGI